MLNFSSLDNLDSGIMPGPGSMLAHWSFDRPICDKVPEGDWSINEKLDALKKRRDNDADELKNGDDDELEMNLKDAIMVFKGSKEQLRTMNKNKKELEDKIEDLKKQRGVILGMHQKGFLDEVTRETVMNQLNDVEIQTMTNLTTIRENVRKNEELMSHLRRFFNIAKQQFTTNELDENDPDNSAVVDHPCPICYARTADHAFVPCGHVVCGECTKNGIRVQCLVCRTGFTKIIKLFFS